MSRRFTEFVARWYAALFAVALALAPMAPTPVPEEEDGPHAVKLHSAASTLASPLQPKADALQQPRPSLAAGVRSHDRRRISLSVAPFRLASNSPLHC